MTTEFKFIKGETEIIHTHEGGFNVLLMVPPAVGTSMHIHGVGENKGIYIHGSVNQVITTLLSPTHAVHKIFLA